MRKFKCIGLEEYDVIFWATYFIVGDVYVEEDYCVDCDIESGLLYLRSGNMILFVNADQFEEVKP